MTPEQVNTFEQCSTDLQAKIDAIVAAADTIRDAIDDAALSLNRCNRSVATLRRTDLEEMEGPLNSVSAAASRHQSIGTALRELEASLAQFENIARDIRLLNPSVVTAVREKLTTALEARSKTTTPTPATPPTP